MSDERLLATFLDLVGIDSPTFEEAAVARYAAEALEACGLSVTFDDSATRTGSDTGNLIAVLPATAPGRRVVLSAHMDCVEPCRGVVPLIEDGVIRAAGETVLGADDKAGVACIIEALRRVTEDGRPHGEVRVILTVAEELGLLGAKSLDPSLVDGDMCLVLDADGSTGGIVVASPTHHTFRARFLGRASHAGVQPEKGVSALAMASRAVCAMTLGRLDAETTANIGTMQGGTATNVVAPFATVTGECRSIDPERAESVRAGMDAAMRDAAEELGGRVEVDWTKEYDGFSFTDDDPVLVLVEDACRDAGVEPWRFKTGGGSDGNIFSADGVPTLVLANGMCGVHGTDETLALEDLYGMARVLEAVLRRVVD